MSKAETWVEYSAYNNKHRLHGDPHREDEVRQTQTLVNGRWLVRWWRRIR